MNTNLPLLHAQNKSYRKNINTIKQVLKYNSVQKR